MSCKIEYSENKELKILTRTFIGCVHMEDVINSWKYLIDNKIIAPSHIGVVSDFRKADIKLDRGVGEIYKLENFFKENINIFKNLRLTQIIITPIIALPMLFEIEITDFKSKPFSTIEAAIDWISK
jgi:hypothetical protein